MEIISELKEYKHEIAIAVFVLLLKIALFSWAGFNFDFQNNASDTFLSIWHRWDSSVYTHIAQYGYTQTNMSLEAWSFLSNFPPLYSFFIYLVSSLFFLPGYLAGVFVSVVCNILASVFLYKLTYLEYTSKKIAWLSVFFLNLYPTAYFTQAVYSESLFLFFSILFFYFLRKKSYWKAATAISAAILTRFVGIALLPLFLWYVLKKFGFTLKSGALILCAVTGNSIYFLINKIYFGSYFYFFTEQLSFDRTKQLIFPFRETIVQFLSLFKSNTISDQSFMFHQGWNALFTLFVTVIILIGMRKLEKKYLFFSVFSVLLFSSLSWGISNARYTLSVFPLFMVLAQIKNKYLTALLLLLFLIAQLYFVKIYTSGGWAF